MQNIIFFFAITKQNVLCKTGHWYKPVEKTRQKVIDHLQASKQHQTVAKNSIIRNRNMDWSCDQTILPLHDLWVGNMAEKPYFYSMNGNIQFMLVNQKTYPAYNSFATNSFQCRG